jgi:HK97 family phage prohead protease
MERRVQFTAQEVRASKSSDGKMCVRGYAATYNTLSKPLPADKNGASFRERIAQGAFKRILRTNPDVVALFNHDANAVLGRTKSGTLRLKEDDKGLAFECDLPDTTAGRDVWMSVKRGDLASCSFAFNLGERMDEWDEEDIEDEKGLGLRGAVKKMAKCIVRTIRDFSQLFDISIVTDPAYPGTSVGARSVQLCAEYRSRVGVDKVRERLMRSFDEERRSLGLPATATLDDVDQAVKKNITKRRSFNEMVDEL